MHSNHRLGTRTWPLAVLALAVWQSAASPLVAQVRQHAFYGMNADGTGWRKLFQLKDYRACGSPAVSPDGKTLAFDAWQVTGNQQQGPALLFTVGMDGTNVRELCPGQMPTWSADGKFLACSRGVQPYGVWIVTADGKDHKQVAQAWGGQWSPDSKQIAYYNGLKLMVYDVESAQTREVLSGNSHGYTQIFWNMTWSPDSKQICLKGANANGSEELALVDARGSQYGFKVRWAGRGLNADFAWHPQGHRLVISLRQPQTNRIQLFELDPTNEDPPELLAGADESLDHKGMCWTPDGKQLIVVASER